MQLKGDTKQTRYRGYVDFEFDKRTMASMQPDVVLKAIEAIFLPENKVAATKIETPELDQTIEEVEGMFGKPTTIINLGPRVTYVYPPNLWIIFTDGKVSDFHLVSEY